MRELNSMLTREELRHMILEEVASAQREISAGAPVRLTRERIRQIVLEEAASLRAPVRAHKRPSLVEALLGKPDEGATGMIYGSADGRTCEQCGAMYESPMAKCEQCGYSMAEYVSRGMSGIGKTRGIEEGKGRRKSRKSMSRPVPKDDPADLGGMSRETAMGMVDKISRKPGPTFTNIVDYARGWNAENPAAYAGTLMRSAGLEPSRGPKLKGKKKD